MQYQAFSFTSIYWHTNPACHALACQGTVDILTLCSLEWVRKQTGRRINQSLEFERKASHHDCLQTTSARLHVDTVDRHYGAVISTNTFCFRVSTIRHWTLGLSTDGATKARQATLSFTREPHEQKNNHVRHRLFSLITLDHSTCSGNVVPTHCVHRLRQAPHIEPVVLLWPCGTGQARYVTSYFSNGLTVSPMGPMCKGVSLIVKESTKKGSERVGGRVHCSPLPQKIMTSRNRKSNPNLHVRLSCWAPPSRLSVHKCVRWVNHPATATCHRRSAPRFVRRECGCIFF